MRLAILTCLSVLLATGCTHLPDDRVRVFRGMCDASAGVALDDSLVLVANDEDNILRLYHAGRGGMPEAEHDCSGVLGIPDGTEADMEGVASRDGSVFWITSHGRDKKGRLRPARHRLVLTTINLSGSGLVVRREGVHYENLVEDLLADARYAGLGLVEAARPDVGKDVNLAPKEEGLNIESLAFSPDGTALLVGFRNPTHNGRAIVAVIRNPRDIVLTGAAPEFGDPVLLDMDGYSLRSMVRDGRDGRYYITAGKEGFNGGFRFLGWSGDPDDMPVIEAEFTSLAGSDELTPEGIAVFPGRDDVLLLSDDGDIEMTERTASGVRRCECKDLLREEDRRFRGVWFSPG